MGWFSDVIGAIPGVGQAIQGNRVANQAMDFQREGRDQADATARYFYDTTRADNMERMDAGNWAIGELRNRLSGSFGQPISVGDVTQEPGYQFGQQEGMNALQAQLAARGMRNSGAALKAGTRFATDYATTKYNDAFNRELTNRNAVLQPLQSVAGLGQSGNATIAAAGQNASNALSNNATGLGNALAAGRIGQYNMQRDNVNQVLGGLMGMGGGGGGGGWYGR